MYYGNYDENGKYIGFYTPEIHCRKVPVYNTEPIKEVREEVTEQGDDFELEPKITKKTITHEPGTVQVGEEWDLSTIPTPYVELTEAEWQQALTGTYQVVNGKHTYTPPPEPTAEEIINRHLSDIDTEYEPQFRELQLAWAAASMDGDTDLAAGVQQDYLALKSEYQTKKEVIINGKN